MDGLDPTPHRLLRIAVGCFLLSAAWGHFFWEAPYRTALESHPAVAESLRIPPEAGDRIALGFAVWFFVAGVVTTLWRPHWLARTLLWLTVVPIMARLAAEAVGAAPAWMFVATRVWGPAAVLALLWEKPGRFLLRLGLTAAFATWAWQGLGLFGEVPADWLSAVRAAWPGGRGDVSHVQVLAGLAGGACLCLWVRPLIPAGGILLALAGLAAVWVPLGVEMEGPAFAWWHRWVPEAVGRLGLVMLPLALWLTGMPRPLREAPRRLKRVDLPVD